MRDYCMTSDGNWLPEDEYLAHWGLRKGQTKQNHKYLMKIGEGAKARYLYTQDEIRAYYNRGKKKIADKTGLSAKKELSKKRNAYSHAKKVTDRRTQIAAKSIRSHGYTTHEKHKNPFTVPEKAFNSETKAYAEYTKALNNYGKTPLGKIDNFIGSVKNKQRNILKRRSMYEAVHEPLSKEMNRYDNNKKAVESIRSAIINGVKEKAEARDSRERERRRAEEERRRRRAEEERRRRRAEEERRRREAERRRAEEELRRREAERES